jgi:neutral ceramidase
LNSKIRGKVAICGNFLIGAGIHDITGPAAGRVLLGYSMPNQKSSGIHMRLWSRAFVIATPDRETCVALVCADLDFIPQAVKLEVIKKLMNGFSPPAGFGFDEKNVLLCANHTHSCPGGYSHYAMYNLAVGGFDQENFMCIADGIYKSIMKASNNLERGEVYINTGDLDGAGWNRSPVPYSLNPQAERDLYQCENTNKKMTLLKFVGDNGTEIGALSWFATHGTNLGNTNKLISGDNKGYASWRFEKDKGTNYKTDKTFVAAFAQAEMGDVSPNIPWGPPDGIHDFERLEIIGNKQYEKAVDLYDSATLKLDANLDYRHTHVDFTAIILMPPFNEHEGVASTCSPAIGLSKIAGSTEDGPGLHIIKEGMNMGGLVKLVLKLLDDPGDDCHKEKQIVLYAGKKQVRLSLDLPGNLSIPLCIEDVYWTPVVLPLQIIRIGQLAILAVPCEFSTMSGRRLRKTVKEALSSANIDELVVASCSNAFSGYVTTREEYSVQHYEGGSTQFGPGTLNAYQQEFLELAESLAGGPSVSPGPNPDDLTQEQKFEVKNKVFWDRTPLGKFFGSVKDDAKPAYSIGDVVKVNFWGGNPKNSFRNLDAFLEVQRKSSIGWEPVAYDWDHETRFKWKKVCFWKSKISIGWKIPQGTPPGEYRICHFGHRKKLYRKNPVHYSGTSSSFDVS